MKVRFNSVYIHPQTFDQSMEYDVIQERNSRGQTEYLIEDDNGERYWFLDWYFMGPKAIPETSNDTIDEINSMVSCNNDEIKIDDPLVLIEVFSGKSLYYTKELANNWIKENKVKLHNASITQSTFDDKIHYVILITYSKKQSEKRL